MKVIKDAMEDPEVRVGHRLSLSMRAERIFNSKKGDKLREEFADLIPLMNYTHAPEVIVQGKCLPA